MKVRDIAAYLEGIAPLPLQEDYDNSGLIVGHENQDITGILCCLDSTEEVIEEAISKKCNLVVAHHPIVFSGLRSLTGKNYIERTVIQAIKNEISIYAIHTNLDSILHHGVSQKLAERLGLNDISVLREKKSISDRITGLGAIGTLPQPMDEHQFGMHLKKNLELKVLRHTSFINKKIYTVAVCGGSGSFLLSDAIAKQADTLVTADFKYHQFFDADGKIVVYDVGHYESEKHTIHHLYSLIRNNFSNFAVYLTKTDTNPVRYL